MKGSLFLSISVGIAALIAGADVFLVALAGVRTLDSMTDYYQEESRIAKERQGSRENVASLATETFGIACAKVLSKFKIISSEDEKRIVSAAADRIEGKSATLRSLVEAMERRSETPSSAAER